MFRDCCFPVDAIPQIQDLAERLIEHEPSSGIGFIALGCVLAAKEGVHNERAENLLRYGLLQYVSLDFSSGMFSLFAKRSF